MKILSDATKKASKTLSEVTEASNDLGQLGKDIQETKTHDMITKIRELIAEKPESSKKSIDKKKLKKSDARPKDSKSKDKKADHHHKTLKIKKLSTETTKKTMLIEVKQVKNHSVQKTEFHWHHSSVKRKQLNAYWQTQKSLRTSK
ncbi:hypothetical protein ABFA07_009786 [Porites harrisoni]